MVRKMEKETPKDKTKCRYCKTEYDNELNYCPSCGVQNEEKGRFRRPERNYICVVYGPPDIRIDKCGDKYRKRRMGEPEIKPEIDPEPAPLCEKCGKPCIKAFSGWFCQDRACNPSHENDTVKPFIKQYFKCEDCNESWDRFATDGASEENCPKCGMSIKAETNRS